MVTTIFGVPLQVLVGQLVLGLVNGAFYAILSLGLAVIFGLLNIVNFAHGALYMMGAFFAWMGFHYLGLDYFLTLVLSPLVVGLIGIAIEVLLIRRLRGLDHIYSLLLTFGLTLVFEGVFQSVYGVSGQPYRVPELLTGGFNLGVMFLPTYRAWVVLVSLLVCFITWFMIEKTRIGSILRASIENPDLVEAFGINVPLLISLTYAFGAALAAFVGVLAAPIMQVSPLMGTNLIIVVFAVVVIGGLGSISGAIISGFLVGVLEGLTKVFYPEAANTVVFLLMVVVLLVKPSGLFGKQL